MSVTSANRLELLQIADAVAREKMIDHGIVIEAMEDAIQRAARARYGAENDIRAKLDRETGDLRLWRVPSKWSRRPRIYFKQVDLEGRAEAQAGRRSSATSSSIRCRRSTSAASPPRPPSRSSSRRSATPSASASTRSSRTAPARSSPASSSASSSATSSSTSAAAEGVIRRDQQIPREVFRVGDRIRALILRGPPRDPRPADLPVSRAASRLHEEAVRAGSAGDLRRHHRDQGRRPRPGQPRQDRRHQPRQLDRPGRRLRRHEGQPRPGGGPGAAGREDRHHPLEPRTPRPSSSTRCSRRRSAASSSTRRRAGSRWSCPTTSSRSPSAAAARTSAWPAS